MEKTKGIRGLLFSHMVALNDHISILDEALTRFKVINAAINELQNIVETFTEKAREGIVIIQDAKCVWANKAASHIYGYTYDELIGKSLTDSTLPALRNKLIARLDMLLTGDTIEMPEEWPILTKERTIRYANVFGYRVVYLGKPAVLFFFYDMTDRKKTQDELLMRSEILDSVSDSVYLLEMSGKIVYVNEALCETTDYTKDELLKMHVLDITAPELRRKLGLRLRQFSEHKEARFDSIAIKKNGLRIPMEVRGKIVKRGGKPFLLGVAREIRPYDEYEIEYTNMSKAKE